MKTNLLKIREKQFPERKEKLKETIHGGLTETNYTSQNYEK